MHAPPTVGQQDQPDTHIKLHDSVVRLAVLHSVAQRGNSRKPCVASSLLQKTSGVPVGTLGFEAVAWLGMTSKQVGEPPPCVPLCFESASSTACSIGESAPQGGEGDTGGVGEEGTGGLGLGGGGLGGGGAEGGCFRQQLVVPAAESISKKSLVPPAHWPEMALVAHAGQGHACPTGRHEPPVDAQQK